MVTMDRYDKYFVLSATVFFIISFYFALTSSLAPDEGTHLLLAIFYRDLFSHVISTSISFENAWNYGLDYLLHYPKLQIAYPPLFHWISAIFLNFEINELFSRLLSTVFYVLSAYIIYCLGKRVFSKKAAVLSAIAFLSFFFTFYFSHMAMQDLCVYFFVILSFYAFLVSREKDSYKLFFVTGFLAALAALSKQMGGMVIVIYTLLLLLEKRWKRALVMIAAFSILIVPYLFVLAKIGGIEINKFQGFLYAFSQGEPTSYLNPELWIWYVFKPSLIYPPLLFFLTVFLLYAIRKEKMWKELTVFFIIFYFGLSVILNKEPRFSTFFMIPAFFAFGKFFERKWKVAIALLASFSLISFALVIEHYSNFQEEEIVKLFEKKGNIAYFGEGGYGVPFSSVIMFETRSVEKSAVEKQRYHFRGCNFVNLTTGEDILNSLKEKGIRYIVYYDNSAVNISLINSKIKFLKKFRFNNGWIEIYEFLGYSKSEEFCNKICLTGWKICKKNGKVFLVK